MSNPISGSAPHSRTPSLPNSIADSLPHNRKQSTPFSSSINDLYVETAFAEAATELKGKFVAVSPTKFLQKYLPECPGMPKVNYANFVAASTKKAEDEMYQPLIDALAPFLNAGWSLVNTSKSPDPNSGFLSNHAIKPALTLYSAEKPSNNNLCRSCDMETFIELKLNDESDGFNLIREIPFEMDNGVARDTRGQVVNYLNAMQASQYRTHGFGVLILGNTCRFLRHTRSGIEVTYRFDYTSSKNSFLQTFFWRLSHATPAARGIDETFELQRDPSDQIKTLLGSNGKNIWKVAAGNRFFYVSKEFTRSHHDPVGRGTRCFVAVDCITLQKCVLKDNWRIVYYHPEGEVYDRLHRHSVVNIPKILAHGDVKGESHSCGVFDRGWHIPDGTMIRRHQHYRIVLGVVGEAISDFRSTWELTKCMNDVIKAHRDAFSKAHVEHRDISPGNILIVRSEDGTVSGNLIDWELSKYQKESVSGKYQRTGTVQFMAARLFDHKPAARSVGDDLESFMLVFLWLSALYAPNNMTQRDRGEALDVYDTENPFIRKIFTGVGSLTPHRFELQSPYLKKVLMQLMDKYKDRYTMMGSEVNEALESPDWMITLIDEALKNEEWKAVSDCGQYQDYIPVSAREKSRKRKSHCPEYDQVPAAKRRRGSEGEPIIPEDDWDDEDDVLLP